MSQKIIIVVDDGRFEGAAVVALSREQGYEFAQMLKRFHFGTAERLSDPTRKDEPQLMIDAVCLVQRGFSEAGIAPR